MFFFFFNDTATTEIYTLSLHDALPIWVTGVNTRNSRSATTIVAGRKAAAPQRGSTTMRCAGRSGEHTSELQSRSDLVFRLLLEKKKNNTEKAYSIIS